MDLPLCSRGPPCSIGACYRATHFLAWRCWCCCNCSSELYSWSLCACYHLPYTNLPCPHAMFRETRLSWGLSKAEREGQGEEGSGGERRLFYPLSIGQHALLQPQLKHVYWDCEHLFRQRINGQCSIAAVLHCIARHSTAQGSISYHSSTAQHCNC